MLDPLNDEEIDEEELFYEFANDLKRLFYEANKDKFNPVSKRIVESLDDWLKSELEEAIENQEK